MEQNEMHPLVRMAPHKRDEVKQRESTATFAIRRGFLSIDGRSMHLITLPEGVFRRWDGCSEEIPPERQSRMRHNFVGAMEFAGCLVE